MTKFLLFAALAAAAGGCGKSETAQASNRDGDPKPVAVATVVRLVEDAGFDPVVVGPLARAREFDAGTPVYVKGMTARQLKEALKLP